MEGIKVDTSVQVLLALLTPSQTRVLQLIANGLSSKEAAEKLQVSKRTVDSHLKEVHERLVTSNRVEAIMIATQLGLISFAPWWSGWGELRTPQLTVTELEVLKGILTGQSSAEIARTRSVSKRTVEFHMSKMRDKFGCHNQIALIRAAWKCNLIDPLAAWGVRT